MMYCPQGSGHRHANVLFALLMIGAGILLFLSNLGWLPIHDLWNYWPLVFVVIGLSRISYSQTPGALVISAGFIVLGLVFTLVSIGILPVRTHNGTWGLSLIFLMVGLAGLARVLDRDHIVHRKRFRPTRFFWDTPPGSQAGAPPGGYGAPPGGFGGGSRIFPDLDSATFMGSVNRKIDTEDFRGGSLQSIFGNITVDLRRARLPTGVASATVDVYALFGAIKIRIPETWRVNVLAAGVLGNVEDKSIPPNMGSAPELVVTGSSVFGTVEIEN